MLRLRRRSVKMSNPVFSSEQKWLLTRVGQDLRWFQLNLEPGRGCRWAKGGGLPVVWTYLAPNVPAWNLCCFTSSSHSILDLMSVEYQSPPVLWVPADSISWQHITVSGPPSHRSDRCNYLCSLWLQLQHNDVVTTDVSVKQTSCCVLEMLPLQFTADHTSPCSSSLKLL